MVFYNNKVQQTLSYLSLSHLRRNEDKPCLWPSQLALLHKFLRWLFQTFTKISIG